MDKAKYVVEVDNDSQTEITKIVKGNVQPFTSEELFELSREIAYLAQHKHHQDLMSKVENGKLYFNRGKHNSYLLAHVENNKSVYFKRADKSGKVLNEDLIDAKTILLANLTLVKNQPMMDLPNSPAKKRLFIGCDASLTNVLSGMGVECDEYDSKRNGVMATLSEEALLEVQKFPADFIVHEQGLPTTKIIEKDLQALNTRRQEQNSHSM